MEKEHPLVKKARLNAEKAGRKADKARDDFFKTLNIQVAIVIWTTVAFLILLSLTH